MIVEIGRWVLREACRQAASWNFPGVSPPSVSVNLAAKQLDDDNLSSAFKAVRDAVAAWLGVDDSPRSPVRWKYAQERVKHRAERLVRIDLRPCRRAKEAP